MSIQKETIEQLITRARCAHFGLPWSRIDDNAVFRGAAVKRIVELANLLAEVTNELERQVGLSEKYPKDWGEQ